MDDNTPGLTISGLNAYWRNALTKAIEDIDGQVASTAMLLVAVQHMRAGAGTDKTAGFLATLAGAIGEGEAISLTIGDITLHLRDEGGQRQ